MKGHTMKAQRAGTGESNPPTKPDPKKSNGNGSKAKGRRFTAKQDDLVDLCILVAYIVQARGQASFDDVNAVIEGPLTSKVHPNTLSKALEALRKKEILAIEFAGGERRYSMKRVKFNCSVEIAHVDKLIPTLKDDTAGVAIMAELAGDVGTGKKPRDYPEDWADYEVTLMLLEPWYGSQVFEGNVYLQDAFENHEHNKSIKKGQDPKTIPLLFDRHPDGKSLSVHKACVAGFIRDNLNRAGKSSYNVDLFGLENLKITVGEGRKNGKNLVISKLPIQAPTNRQGASGAGFGYYETLMPGQKITWRFSAPTKNFMTPAEMERWLRRVLCQNRRSMSPARGTQTGAAELLEVKCSKWSVQDKDAPKEDQQQPQS
jgi:hypothetical protein